MSVKIRDAGRSRAAILDAAETLFAQRGYDATSLNEIAAAAGLSRGTPSYFFGSKDQLYLDVLERAFGMRHAATKAAFAPVRGWAETGSGLASLRSALAEAIASYLRFLDEQPAFVRLVMREELGGGSQLRALARTSTAMSDAFADLRRVAAERGLRAFDVQDAILVCISLTFAPMAYRNTLMRAVGRDLGSDEGRRRQVALAVDQLMSVISG